jgi:dihydrofolate reductase
LTVESERTIPVSKVIEATHVSLGGEQGDNAWAHRYLDEEHHAYASTLLRDADMLLLGRRTYEGLSNAYMRMAVDASDEQTDFNQFVGRMNRIPKLVASTTLAGRSDLTWNASVIAGDVAETVSELKQRPGHDILKYGNGRLSATLARENLIDEYHLFLTPVAIGVGHHLFADFDWAPHLKLLDVTRFTSGVVVLIYGPS